MSHIKKLSPLVGESVSGADERGKCEQTCEMIRTCVHKLAPIASQARHFPRNRGQLTTKEKEFIVFIFYIKKRKPPPCLLSGGLLLPEIDLSDYFTL